MFSFFKDSVLLAEMMAPTPFILARAQEVRVSH